MSALSGTVTEDEVQEHNRRLRRDPLFNPDYQQLVDLREITNTKVGSDFVRDTARDQYFAPGVRRAFVATNDYTFGMARVFAAVAETQGQTIAVFRNIAEAEEWLGLSGPTG